MPRLLFEKTGDAVWISHLDLMRLWQRAFKRAGLMLTHTQGFNPRPSVSIAMPMSVGMESIAELLDFDLDGERPPCDEICRRLNSALVPGVKCLKVYDQGRKLRELSQMDCRIALRYIYGLPDHAEERIRALFEQEALPVEKRGKNGPVKQNIRPMIKSLNITAENDSVVLSARICCQEPSLNPMQLAAAVEHYLPDLKADEVLCRRLEIYDKTGNIFR